MTPEDIALVQQTMSEVSGSMETLTATFYERLFARNPSLQSLFGSDPASQRRKFGEELTEIVAVIRDFHRLTARTHELGARHERYGVTASHYGDVEAALLGTLEEVLGARFTPDVASAWRQAFDLVAETMIEGATSASGSLAT